MRKDYNYCVEKFLAVQVEHSRYVSLFKLDRPMNKELSLTTLVDNQKQADVRVYLIVDGNKIHIHTFVLSNLPRKKSGELRISLKASFDGRSSVHFRLSLDGRLHETQRLSLRKHLKKKRSGHLLWLIPLLLLIAALLFLLLGPGMCSSTSDKNTDTVGTSRPIAAPSSGQTFEQTSEPEKQPPPRAAIETNAAKTEETGIKTPMPAEATTHAESAPTGTASAKTAEPAGSEPAGSEPAAAAFTLEKQVYFQPDNANLTGEARKLLIDLADTLKEHPEAPVAIFGHCALYGTEKGRIELSQQRAEQVADFLRDRGWKPETLPEIRGLGGNQPVTRNSENQYLNRRVEIIVPPPDSNISSRRDR